MNWYKISQVPIKERSEHEENYFDIGHLQYWDKEDEKLKKHEEKTWFWDKGHLYICNFDLDHELCIRQNIEQMKDAPYDEVSEYQYGLYKGRFGNYNGTKFVSMIVPTNRMFSQVPSALIRDLMNAFGDDITIYRFN